MYSVSVSDTDAGSNLLRVSLAVSHGTLSLAAANGLNFVYGDRGSPKMTFMATIADANIALRSLSYRSVGQYHGRDVLIMSVDDDEGEEGKAMAEALGIS